MTRRALKFFAAGLLLVLSVVAFFATRPVWADRQTPTVADGIPKFIDVNGIEFRVSIEPLVPPLYGYTYCESRTILLTPASDYREHLMHELSHAMVCMDAGGGFVSKNAYFNQSSDEEHEGIYRFARMWAELFRRNPQVARYMAGDH